jgi:hypothetical protein
VQQALLATYVERSDRVPIPISSRYVDECIYMCQDTVINGALRSLLVKIDSRTSPRLGRRK